MEVQELGFAASQGDLRTVQRILQQPGGVNVNAGDQGGWRVLHYAVNGDHLAIVQAVLQVEGVNVDVRTNNGLAPLHMACIAKAGLPVFHALLEAGADPNAVNNAGFTPLLYLVTAACPISTVEALLDAGANPAARYNDLDTPLHSVCYWGRLEVIQLLIRRQGPECLALKNDREQTPLDRLSIGDAYSIIPSGVANSTRQHILQAYAGMHTQRDGLFCLHSVLQDSAFIEWDDDEDEDFFLLPVGVLTTQHLQSLLKFMVAAEPSSVVALDGDGLLPLQVAIELNFPASVLYVLLRPHPDMLFHASFPLRHPQGWRQLASEKVSLLCQAARRLARCCNRWLRPN